MDYDPTKIGYRELLDIFWDSHFPTSPSYSRQYMSIIFYHDEEQRRLAEASKREMETKWGKPVYTEIVPYSKFYLAEDYHQKYRLRNKMDFFKWYLSVYPDPQEFVDSTAVTRVNGYLGRNGSADLLESEIDALGLTPELRDKLWKLVAGPGMARPEEAGTSCPTGSCG
jgi:peptide-methionine (S)-S-oxide reductase